MRDRGWSLRYFLVVVTALAVVPVVVGIRRYGEREIWPGLIGGFSATLVAFLVALYADRQRAREQTEAERRREIEQAEAAASREHENRVTEAARAFDAILSELAEVRWGLDEAIPQLTPGEGHVWWVLPSLPTGVWRALAPRVGVLSADVQLVAALAAFSTKMDDVRWSLRYRPEKGSETVESNLTVGLSDWARGQAEAARASLTVLRPRVAEQAAHPEVRRVAVVFQNMRA